MDRIKTFQDLLDILDNHPEWAQALRERLLTPELLALPESLAAFAKMVNTRFEALETDMAQVKADVADVKTDMAQVKADVADVKTDMAQVKTDVADVKTDMAQARIDIGDLKGHGASAATRKMNGTIMQAANIRRPRWLETEDINEISENAEDEGRANIPAEDLESFRNIDFAIKAVDKNTSEPCFVVIECSYTLTKNDVERAQRNAGYMHHFTGTPSKAMASASSIPDEVRIFAAEHKVTCITISNKAAAPR